MGGPQPVTAPRPANAVVPARRLRLLLHRYANPGAARTVVRRLAHDRLTGLLNRDAFHQMARAQLATSLRANRRAPDLVLAVIRLCHLHRIAALHGAGTAEVLCRSMAAHLRQVLPIPAAVGHLADDLFVALLERPAADTAFHAIPAAVGIHDGFSLPLAMAIHLAPVTDPEHLARLLAAETGAEPAVTVLGQSFPAAPTGRNR